MGLSVSSILSMFVQHTIFHPVDMLLSSEAADGKRALMSSEVLMCKR